MIPFLLLTLFLGVPQVPSHPAPYCLVKVEALFGKYEGECQLGKAHGQGYAEGTDSYSGSWKRGFPHGEGTYMYADGGEYTGQFVQGSREGAGTMTHPDGREEQGYWTDDVYMGTQKNAYEFVSSVPTSGFSMHKANSTSNDITIELSVRGNDYLGQVSYQATSGTPYQSRSTYGFRDVEYPVDVNVKYQVKEALSIREVEISIRIYHPGEWKIRMRH